MSEGEVTALRLDALVLAPALQFRSAIDPQNVDRLVAAYDSSQPVPPIEVGLVDGVPLVTDGWHRVAALRRLGWKSVDARVQEMTSEEAQLRAALANLGHGLNLKTKERTKAQRTALALYLRMKRHLTGKGKGKVKSFREIGADLGGLDHTKVRRWIIQHHPRVAKAHWALTASEGAGGLRKATPKVTLEGVAQDALKNALAAFQGISDPEQRGAIILQAEAVLEQMKAAGEWRIEADPGEDF